MNKKQLEEGRSFAPQFQKRQGLLPVIVQDIETMQVLTLGYANAEALEETIHSKKATFWSTSRNELWTKGKTSGDYLEIVEILTDCDQDALVYQVKVLGNGVCHTKNEHGDTRKACFYRKFSFSEDKLVFEEK